MSDTAAVRSLGVNAPRTTKATRNVIEGVVIGTVLTALSYAVGYHYGWERPINKVEVFAVFTSYICTYLCVKERRINYPIGAASTAAFVYIFAQAHLWASMAQNIYLTPWLLYGWYRWRRDVDARPVTRLNRNGYLLYAGVGLAGYVGFYLINTALGGHSAAIDTFVFVGSLVAQVMLDNKKLENWCLWFVVDVVAIYDYYHNGLYLVMFQFVFFLLTAVWGFYGWWDSMQHEGLMRSMRENGITDKNNKFISPKEETP